MIQRLTKPAHAAVLREQARRLEQEAAALVRLAETIESEDEQSVKSARPRPIRP